MKLTFMACEYGPRMNSFGAHESSVEPSTQLVRPAKPLGSFNSHILIDKTNTWSILSSISDICVENGASSLTPRGCEKPLHASTASRNLFCTSLRLPFSLRNKHIQTTKQKSVAWYVLLGIRHRELLRSSRPLTRMSLRIGHNRSNTRLLVQTDVDLSENS